MTIDDYKLIVWKQAMRAAELDVMRLTATSAGCRLPNEALEDYVARSRRAQDLALDKWRAAKLEVERQEVYSKESAQ